MRSVSKLLALVVIVAVSASCGLSKKFKSKQAYQLETVNKRDSSEVSSSYSKGQVKEQTTDRGKVVTERTTTTVTEKPSGNSRVVINKDDLKPGENYLLDSAGNQIKAVLDTLGKTLTLDIVTPGEKSTRTTNERITEQKDETNQREENNEEQQNKQVGVTNEQRRNEKSSSAVSNSQPSATGIFSNWIGAAVTVLLVVIGLAWWFFGIRKNR
ncbi:hypothetical protein [Sphingobacterium suaedae]|uniref:Uncharacterized protein n=1 Tax=Sphingobacterium suaedae TaxID=1686402 RepID=A0ABW5KH67_9SPHI